jgi:hypothetical protein
MTALFVIPSPPATGRNLLLLKDWEPRISQMPRIQHNRKQLDVGRLLAKAFGVERWTLSVERWTFSFRTCQTKPN